MKEITKKQLNTKRNKRKILVLAIIAVLAVSTGITSAYLFMKTSTVLNTFVNGDNPYGAIQISKTVEHPYGEGYVVPDSRLFAFEVNLGRENAGKTFSGCKADENGVITVKLGAGKIKTINRIPADVKAVITEKDIPEGFSISGEGVKEVTVEKAKTAKADFVNTYTPEKASTDAITVKGEKILEGREWDEKDAFSLSLEQYVNGAWTKIATKKATKNSKEFDFTEDIRKLSFDKRQVYSFRVTEDKSDVNGIIYDTKENMFDITVDDADMDGYLEIADVASYSDSTKVTTDEETGEKTVDIEFVNTYIPKGVKTAHIHVTKNVTDLSGQGKTAAGYRFGLFDDGGNQVGDDCVTSAAGEVTFSFVCSAEDIGTRHYVVKEIKNAEKGTKYDNSEHLVALSVEDDPPDDIKVRLYDAKANSAPKGAEASYNVEFTNQYDPENAKLTLSGDKELSGRDIKKGEFRFILFNTDSTYSTDGCEPVDVQENIDSNGTFKFDLSYNKPGTYYYVVREKDNNIPGISYDRTEYMVKVDVTDEGGELAAKAEVLNGTGSKKEIVFKNSYVPGSGILTLSGTKKLEGKSLRRAEFGFALCEADSNFNETKQIMTAANGSDGKFSFGDISYDREGTHYYTVKEISKNPEENVTYDNTVYKVKVTVKDNKEGKLAVEKEITAVNGDKSSKADNISFENEFSAPYASLDITATKRLLGKELEDGMFSFDLYSTEPDYKSHSEKVMSVKNNADGTIFFNDIRLDKEGTYYFVLKEKEAKDKEEITYDKSEYRITAIVKTNDKGQLVAEIKSIEKKGSGKTTAIKFLNTYENSSASSKTGDRMQLLLWALMMLISGVGILTVVIQGVQSGKKHL